MKVWKRSVHTSPIDIYSKEKDPIQAKGVYWAPVFVDDLSKYFLERTYGSRVSEVLYRQFCLKEGYIDKLLYYGSRKKIIDCAIVLDYELVLAMDDSEYGRYLAKLYVKRSGEFGNLNIKDFDSELYLQDLMDFFSTKQLLPGT